VNTDPAERNRVMRLFYRDWRPTRLGRITNRITGWFAATGFPPHFQVVLEVTGRRSGRRLSTVLVAPELDGNRYFVSMLGKDSSWVRNVLANPEAIVRHGRRQPVRLIEVPVSERAPVLKEYVRIATSGRTHFPADRDAPICEFEAIAEQYPVFRADPR
jgi:deazaflavin-dependent oxidoreductase (nitroreductase family)